MILQCNVPKLGCQILLFLDKVERLRDSTVNCSEIGMSNIAVS